MKKYKDLLINPKKAICLKIKESESESLVSINENGDRLKKVSNIIKSLLIFGNIFNCLADKAIGKNKNILPT